MNDENKTNKEHKSSVHTVPKFTHSTYDQNAPKPSKFQELEDQSIKKLPKGLGKAREDLTGAKFENMESQPAVK